MLKYGSTRGVISHFRLNMEDALLHFWPDNYLILGSVDVYCSGNPDTDADGGKCSLADTHGVGFLTPTRWSYVTMLIIRNNVYYLMEFSKTSQEKKSLAPLISKQSKLTTKNSYNSI